MPALADTLRRARTRAGERIRADAPPAAPEPPSLPEPALDRASDALAQGTPEPLRSDLETLLGPGRVLHRASDLIRYASDASPYRVVPQAVVMAHDATEVAKLLAYARAQQVPVTFRAGGTSLNGQAQGGGILIDVRRHFAGIEVLNEGEQVRVRPGTVLGRVNRALRRYERRVGPDPASTDYATVGGVIANNSGGMRCGVAHDAYSTLRSLVFTLPSGTTIDTSAPDAAERFAQAEPELAHGLEEIREEIRADAALAARIRRKFEIKNTTGYRLCAFLDAEEPVHIFARLLVGSEGTLGFVSEAVFETVPHGRHTATALLHYDGIDAACAPVGALVAAGASATELMVNPSLIAASHMLPGMPESWRELPPEGAALLVELRSGDPAELDELERAAHAALAGHEPLAPADFTRDRDRTEILWRVREGMQGIVAAVRTPGSTFIIEDVCVPPARIAEAAHELQELLGRHGFLTGVAGHVSAGNLHFLLTPTFSEQADRERYEAFMEGLVELVLDRYDGSLKAEHGTGRNMAPYVEREWGPRATELMWKIKRLADPQGVLAPDVVLSRAADLHLRDLKTLPPIEQAGKAHTCIECGFCEPVCPSRDLTTTPRQRIVLRREMARQPEGSPLRRALLEQYPYDAIDTCAADGSCALACPLGIDTGALVKELRSRSRSPRAQRAGERVARRWSAAERAARAALRSGGALAGAIGERPLEAASDLLRRGADPELVPRWSSALPQAAVAQLPQTTRVDAAAVYLPACINRIFGPSRRAEDGPGVVAALVAVSARAGLPVWIPPDAAGHCCSVPWSSKGLTAGRDAMAERLAASVRRWSGAERLPLVIDASSCAHGAAEALAERGVEVEVLDPLAWAHEWLLPQLEVKRRVGRAAIHATCSARHLGQAHALEELAAALADEVVTPIVDTCCGMAGDRGLLHPELTASATRPLAEELAAAPPCDAYLSSNRTCEIALEQATGRPFASIIELLDQATR